MYSALFRNATVVDGSGGLPFLADVAVVDGVIADIAPTLAEPAKLVVDAHGLVLAPGFIDIHGHSDMTLFTHPGLESKAFQGVTLEVIGNCGLGAFPVAAGRERELAAFLKVHDFSVPFDGVTWSDLEGYANRINARGLGIHLAPLVGHGALRIAAMGMENRSPTAEEVEMMRRLLETALLQGAWGMSTGLIYPPGSYADTLELIELARILTRHDALYASHIRSESEGLFPALNEAITIGRESGARVQVSHLKALGRSNRGKGKALLEILAAARESGLDIGADQYPYEASATTLTAVVPAWAHEGGVSSLMGRLRTPELQVRLIKDIDREIANREGADGIMVSGVRSRQNLQLSGKSLVEIANTWGCSPAGAVIRLLSEEEGCVGAVFFSMDETDVTAILSDHEVAVGSDGHGLHAELSASESTHPRSYGTFPRVLGSYVRENNHLTLTDAIRKMTAIPAGRLGMTNRGLVRPGYAADLVLFDPETIGDRADYADPHRYSQGVIHLLVDGKAVIRDGKSTGVRPGRLLRKGYDNAR
jgi:N-acyl-D-amino-acid deacylase